MELSPGDDLRVTDDLRVADPADPDVVAGDLHGFELLRVFNRVGLLAAADVHTAVRLAQMAGERDQEVVLAVAFAVRAPRVGHVSIDLPTVRASVIDEDEEIDLDVLPWPEAAGWAERVAASDLVAAERPGDGPPGDRPPGDRPPGDRREDGAAEVPPLVRPLVLAGSALYLERYWRDEVAVAHGILSRLRAAGAGAAGAGEPGSGQPGSGQPGPGGAHRAREARLQRLFPGPGSADQLRAARMALSGRFTVIAGGPGTGKTTTVARMLAALFEEAEADQVRAPLVGLAAPTGKAAARMEEAVRAEAGRLGLTPVIRTRLDEVSGSTIHRLLGTRFGRTGQFRHHGGHRLPHDLVVIDEASMVSLSLMARLVEAVRPDARLVLVGDPEQLVSVEAGAVLADIVGPAGVGPGTPGAPVGTAAGTPGAPAGTAVGTPGAPAGSICILRRNHRFAGPLAVLAGAVREGRSDEAVAVLSAGDQALEWVEADPAAMLLGEPGSLPPPLAAVSESTAAWAREVVDRAGSGDVAGAIDALRGHRVLCAHRRGAAGVRAWNMLIEGWISDTVYPAEGTPAEGADRSWYPGRPVLMTVNDYAMRLFNGDTGVAVRLPADPGQAAGPSGDPGPPARLHVAFDAGRDRPPRLVSPFRLDAVETVYAMTVHKSQGSEFDRVTLLVPPSGSRLLTREMLYTAITRARHRVTVVGTRESIRTAVETPIARASGLGARLWGSP